MEENEKIENKSQEEAKTNIGKMAKVEKILSKTVKTILNLIYALLGIIVIILIYNIIQVGILNKPYMNFFGYSFFEVQTGSMSGTIEIGDIIIVKITEDVKENDIITYEKDQILITHRIVEIQEGKIITKGDVNNKEDEPITSSEVIGKVIYTFKNVEIWKSVFKTPEVYLLIIATLVLFGIASSIGEDKKK